jgi:predicted nucleic acid-binding protein
VKIVVQDASVLIDLAVGDCLTAWFGAGVETHTTAPVLLEVEQDVKRFVRQRKLRVFQFEGEELLELLDFQSRHSSRLSFEDCSVFYLAEKLDGILVTGDKALRNTAAESGREVHGTLWILDVMVDLEALAPLQAAASLEKLTQRNPRLPKAECEERLRRWKKIK